jgi:hypothetical protein
VGIVPAGTIIPARGHFLFVGSSYSLSAVAAGDATLTADIGTNQSVALFSTTSATSISSVNRLDAVGFTASPTGNCALLGEGNGLTPLNTSILTVLEQASYVRDTCGKLGSATMFGVCPTNGDAQDTNNNALDFYFVDTQAGEAGPATRLGAPGPEQLYRRTGYVISLQATRCIQCLAR